MTRKAEPFSRADFTIKLAREHFGYDPELGRVIRLRNPRRGPQTAGQIASKPDSANGLRRVKFRGLLIYEHHLVWALVKGEWPVAGLRHRDGNGENNRIGNLVEATRTVQSNRLLQTGDRADENLPLSGVVPTSSGKFKALIYRGRMWYLGTFETAKEASQAYERAKKVLHNPLNCKIPTEDLLNLLF
jgi:hypothetical protein